MKRRVEFRCEEDLLSSVDEAATFLKMNRTDFLTRACKTYLLSIRQNRKSLKADP
jgi:uncharacterized protein (DUF1778 family)